MCYQEGRCAVQARVLDVFPQQALRDFIVEDGIEGSVFRLLRHPDSSHVGVGLNVTVDDVQSQAVVGNWVDEVPNHTKNVKTG